MLRDYMAYYVVGLNDINGNRSEKAGFYPAATLTEAMSYIEEFYGDELIEVQHLELLDISIVHMNPELAKQVVNENFC